MIPTGVPFVHWGDYSYTIPRIKAVTLDEIFTDCGITAIDSTDVDSISVSDSSILEVTEDLTVKCLKSFTEPQTLTIQLKNSMSGHITVQYEYRPESGNLNEFIDGSTTFSYVNETKQHPISEAAIGLKSCVEGPCATIVK